MPELKAWRSAQVRRHRHAVECRLRHRLVLLPRPTQAGPPQAARVRSVSRTHRQWRAARWHFNSLAESVVALGEQATPTSRPRWVFVAEVRGCASCSFGRRLSLPCPVHDHVVERAVEDGAGKSGARLRLDAALEAAEDCQIAGLQARRADGYTLGGSERLDGCEKRAKHAKGQVQFHHLHPEQDEASHTEHGKTGKKDEEKRLNRKAPRDLGPEDIIVHTREGGPTVQLCGTVMWRANGSMLNLAQGTQYKEIIRISKEFYTHGGREEQPHRSRTSPP